MVAEARREVIFVLKTEASKDAEATMRKFTDGFARAQESINKAQKKQLDQHVKDLEWWRKQADKTYQDAAAAELKALEKSLRDNERVYKAKAAEVARYENAVRSANVRMAEGFKQGLTGAVQLGRAITLLGVIGEKDLDRVIHALVRFQAAADTIRGVIDLVQGATKAYAAMRAAILSAAAAQAALNATQAGGAARGAAGGAAGLVASGGAGLAGAGLAGRLAGGGAALAGAAGGGAVLAGAAAAGVGAGLVAGRVLFPGGISELLGLDSAASNVSSRQLAGFEARQQIRNQGLAERFSIESQLATGQADFAAERAGLIARRGQRGLAADAADNAAQLASRRRELGEAQAAKATAFFGDDISASSAQAQHAALERERGALEAIKRLEQDRLRIAEQTMREKAEGINREIAGIQRTIDLEKQKLEAGQKGLLNAAQRFGSLDAEQRDQTLRSFRKFQAGDKLNNADLQRLSSVGFEDQAAELLRTAAFDSGFGEIAKVLEEQNKQRADAIRQLESQVSIKEADKQALEASFQKIADSVSDQLVDVIDQLADNFAQSIERSLADLSARLVQQAAQTRAAG